MRQLEYEALTLKWHAGCATEGEVDDIARYMRRDFRSLTTRLEHSVTFLRIKRGYHPTLGQQALREVHVMASTLTVQVEEIAEVMPPSFREDFTGITARLESLRSEAARLIAAGDPS